MGATPRVVSRLIEALSRLPGIGPKTASRLAYHLLRSTNLLSAFTGAASNLPAVPPENTYTDSPPATAERVLYRVRVD